MRNHHANEPKRATTPRGLVSRTVLAAFVGAIALGAGTASGSQEATICPGNAPGCEDVLGRGYHHQRDLNSFALQPNGEWVAHFTVEAGESEGLLLDVDASVRGTGYYDTGFECHAFHLGPAGQVRLGAAQPPFCHHTSVDPSDQFYFDVELSVYCDGEPVGSDHEELNETLTPDDVAAIRNSVDRTWGWVSGEPYPTRRSLDLLLGHRGAAADCSELAVVLKERNGTRIDGLQFDITIIEIF